jgi:hypothetical protein
VDQWLTTTCAAVAEATGVDPATLDLSDDDMRTILDLARVAAHESGERTNAPLLCYLAGLVRAGGTSLDTIAGAVRRSSS